MQETLVVKCEGRLSGILELLCFTGLELIVTLDTRGLGPRVIVALVDQKVASVWLSKGGLLWVNFVVPNPFLKVLIWGAKWKRRPREILDPLVHFPDGCNHCVWVRWNQEPWAPSAFLGWPAWLPVQVRVQGVDGKGGKQDSRVLLMRRQHQRRWLNWLHHSASPSTRPDFYMLRAAAGFKDSC